MRLNLNLILVAFVFLLTSFSSTADNEAIKVYTFEEFEHRLYADTDSIYIVNFWATWCAPCVKEIPDFEKIHKQYKDDKVKVLFVSLDFVTQIESRVLPFIERMDMQAEVVLLNDPRSSRWIPEVSDIWTGAIPATLVYTRDHRAFYEREFNFQQLEEIILPLIN